MTASADAGRHAFDVELGALETDIPDGDFDPTFCRLAEQARDRVAAECGFKNKVVPFPDGTLQHLAALLPCQGARLSGRQLRVRFSDLARCFVRVVVIDPLAPESRAPDAALACAVDAGENVDAWRSGQSAPPSRRLDRRTSKLRWRGVERCLHSLPGSGCLQAVEQVIEAGAELVEGLGTCPAEGLELLIGEKHSLRRVVAGDRDRAR